LRIIRQTLRELSKKSHFYNTELSEFSGNNLINQADLR